LALVEFPRLALVEFPRFLLLFAAGFCLPFEALSNFLAACLSWDTPT